jgi:protein-histidine N-methyltransferase
MAFSFGFSGDDIQAQVQDPAAAPAPAPAPARSKDAFPQSGKPQLPPTHHSLPELLNQLPSKVAFNLLDPELADGSSLRLPRRELWDIRAQAMAEDEMGNVRSTSAEGLGNHDVRTGVYEGGFKSWESSVDLVKALHSEGWLSRSRESDLRVVELGCGTALPSLALFLWAIDRAPQAQGSVTFIVADYNVAVLERATMPNFLLAWAISQRDAVPALASAFEFEGESSLEGELELSPEILAAFQASLAEKRIELRFLSGGWSQEFMDLLYGLPTPQQLTPSTSTLVLGAETIYSPFALQAFTEILFTIMQREQRLPHARTVALVAAKRLYFGVGGSLDDFIETAENRGAVITKLSEETEGVRRGVVRCVLQEAAQAGVSVG